MTKAEFTQEILRRTGHLSRAEVDKWISFYSECVDDRMEEGMDEAEAVARLGNMEDILKSMEQETPGAALPSVYTASPDTYPAPSDAYTESPRPKKEHRTLWKVLAICGSPLWLPVAAGLAVAVLALYLSLWAVLLALYIVVASFGFAALVGLGNAVWAFDRAAVPTGLLLLGAAFVCLGLCLLLIPAAVACTRGLVWLALWLVRLCRRPFTPKAPQPAVC